MFGFDFDLFYIATKFKLMCCYAGNILGATEFKSPVNYKYNDLKAATRNFNDENKLGEGGFGDVYKVS